MRFAQRSRSAARHGRSVVATASSPGPVEAVASAGSVEPGCWQPHKYGREGLTNRFSFSGSEESERSVPGEMVGSCWVSAWSLSPSCRAILPNEGHRCEQGVDMTVRPQAVPAGAVKV